MARVASYNDLAFLMSKIDLILNGEYYKVRLSLEKTAFARKTFKLGYTYVSIKRLPKNKYEWAKS